MDKIYTINILNYYLLLAFTVTRKKEKNRQEPEIIISRITARGKKKKYHRTKKKKKKEKKKEKANFVTPVEKNQEICSQLVKRKRKIRRKYLQCYNYKSAQYEVEPFAKIKSRVGIFLLKFGLNGSSGSFVPTNDKGENAIFINQNLFSWKFTLQWK